MMFSFTTQNLNALMTGLIVGAIISVVISIIVYSKAILVYNDYIQCEKDLKCFSDIQDLRKYSQEIEEKLKNGKFLK